MGFLKKILNRSKPEPISTEIKDKIHNLVIKNLETYEENYNNEFSAVIEEWKEAEKELDFTAIDNEAHNKAGVETVKDEISKLVWNETEDDVERNVKAQTENEIAMKAAKKAGEKAVEKMVSKAVDQGLEKMTEKQEEKS